MRNPCQRCGRRPGKVSGYCPACYSRLISMGYCWDPETGQLAEPCQLFGERRGPACSGSQIDLLEAKHGSNPG
jgi:hypothetical protein